MSALSPRARDLFARARAEGAPSAADRARVLERVSKAIAEPSAPPPAPPAGLSMTARMLLAIAALGTIAAVSWSGIGEGARRTTPPIERVMPAAVAIETPVSPTESARVEATAIEATPIEAPPTPIADVAPSAPARTRAPRPARPIEPASDLAAELALLRTAQRARRAGDLPAALAALDEHATQFPEGVLANERDVTRAAVVCESGDLAHGRALAAPFASSAWAGALAQACAATTDAPSAEESTSIDDAP
jgi:hypothetical protein